MCGNSDNAVLQIIQHLIEAKYLIKKNNRLYLTQKGFEFIINN
jgi:predicted transcriptional regulator